MKQQRYTNLDLLRILACFMVIVIHTASMQFGISVHSFSWAVFNFSDGAMRSSVPLFLMISGMLMMSREECSVKKLLLKSIPRLLLIFFLWAALYAVDGIGPMTLIRNFDLGAFLQEVWNFDAHASHLSICIQRVDCFTHWFRRSCRKIFSSAAFSLALI